MSKSNTIQYKKDSYNKVNTVLLTVAAIISIYGVLYLTLLIAVKDPKEMVNPLSFPSHFHFQNFKDAWVMTNYPRKFFNTLFITVVNVFFTIITNSAVAYVIARYRKSSKLINGLYYYFLSAMFIPFQVLMLPLVKQASNFHLDNIFGITLLYIVFGLPMNTFLYTGYLKSVPKSLDEAAYIDGANPFQVFFKVIFPAMKPMHSTVAIFSIMWTWNDFLMPLILLSDTKQQTLQLSQYVFKTEFSTNYNLSFASYVMVLIPVLITYVFLQRFIIAGVVNGSVKE
ncbi:MAG: carbohydrate ABC transporter permease [Sphaerochaeta sp.]